MDQRVSSTHRTVAFNQRTARDDVAGNFFNSFFPTEGPSAFLTIRAFSIQPALHHVEFLIYSGNLSSESIRIKPT